MNKIHVAFSIMENLLVYALLWILLPGSSILPPPPGIDPIQYLTDTVNNLTMEIQNLKAGNTNDDVAFFARLRHDIHLGDSQQIAFDDIVTNVGNAYDGNNGEFITPIRGTYQFTVVTMGYGGETLKLSLVKNGTPIADILDALDAGHLGTQTVILQLNVGDKIWIKNADSVGKRLYGGELYNTFSGFKLN